MNILNLKSDIKRNKLNYQVGDKVILFRKNINGYPKKMSFDIYYDVKHVTNDKLCISIDRSDIYINKMYFLPINIYLSIVRDDKLKILLNEF